MRIEHRNHESVRSKFTDIGSVSDVRATADTYSVSLTGSNPGTGKEFRLTLTRNELALLNMAANQEAKL